MSSSGPTPCPQCSWPLAEGARVCTQCGRPVSPEDAQPAKTPLAAQTMLGFASPLAPKTAPQAATPAPAAPQAEVANMKTMMGFASPFAAPSPQAQPRAQPQPQPVAPTPAPAAVAPMAKTMLGVAVPGIAPMVSSPQAGTPAASAPQPAPAPQAPKAFGGTMLGVAVPGIAPLHSSPGAPPPQQHVAPAPQIAYEPPPPIVPAPAPLMQEAAPSKPSVVVQKRGAPIAIVAVIASLVVLAGGVVLLVVSRSGAPPLTASAKVSADGKEQLHLTCDRCPDGTTAAWQGAKATFANKEADLDLPAPLAIGDNTFQIALDRPGVGRDETVKLVLPLAYRIRGDLSALASATPAIDVVVEAQQGTSVKVDGKPVTLDASGRATVGYDVTQETTGATDETRTIEKKIPYEVIDKDKKKSTGEVAVRVAVLPLHVDAPGASLVTADATAWVSGRTAKGSAVTANGKALAVAADGAFEGQVDLQDGAQTITVRAASADDAKTIRAAPRSATVQVKRVASVDAEAKALDAQSTLGWGDATRDPAGNAGKPFAASGTVLEARAGHHQTVLLVDDKRGCAKGPCMVRVEHGADDGVRAGDAIAAYGTLGKPFSTPDGKTLLVLDASLVRKGTKK